MRNSRSWTHLVDNEKFIYQHSFSYKWVETLMWKYEHSQFPCLHPCLRLKRCVLSFLVHMHKTKNESHIQQQNHNLRHWSAQQIDNDENTTFKGYLQNSCKSRNNIFYILNTYEGENMGLPHSRSRVTQFSIEVRSDRVLISEYPWKSKSRVSLRSGLPPERTNRNNRNIQQPWQELSQATLLVIGRKYSEAPPQQP